MDMTEYFQTCLQNGMKLGLELVAKIDEQVKHLPEPERTITKRAMLNKYITDAMIAMKNVSDQYNESVKKEKEK